MRIAVVSSFMFRNTNTQNTINPIFNRLHEYTQTPITTITRSIHA